jgi:DNA modification methylase
VKPVELMKYLIKLVTPKGGTVLDPFCGSGSTGMAAVELGHTFIGCELDENYVAIAKRRIEAWNDKDYGNNFKDLFDEE